MPIQLRVIAVILAILFFAYTINLVKKDKAEMRHMLKWLVLAIIILLGSLLPGWGSYVAHVLGISTLSSLALFILVGVLVVINLRFQMSIISAEKQIRKLVQELSILKKKVEELEHKDGQ